MFTSPSSKHTRTIFVSLSLDRYVTRRLNSACSNSQIGDGTTSVVLLAGELLKECKSFIEEGVHPQVIARAYRLATQLALKRIKEIAVQIPKGDEGYVCGPTRGATIA